MPHQKPSLPTSVFCMAAPSDATLLAQWEMHLRPLQQAKQITIWSEKHIAAGTSRLQQINGHMDQAQVIVFLLSADFFASDGCIELMERALEGSARVVSLLLRPCDWKTSKLSNLACLPSDGTFVTNWKSRADAFHTCVQDFRRLLGSPAMLPQTRQQARKLALHDQNLVRMLRRLRRSYSDLINQSLQGTTWLELHLAGKPDAVQNATHLLLRMSNRAEQHLPLGTSITEAYDEAEHELLILGEPGAGKSTLLLDLAQQLIGRTEQDQTHSLPVILPLSSWATKRPLLQDWIAMQMSEIYDVPHKLSVQWVREGRILPLLDGLDEVEENARAACITAINVYHRDHMTELVVCSRIAEYESAAGSTRLALQAAIVVQPLTHEHVDNHLVQAGKPLAALRNALKKNSALHELATIPLMLNILILTYQGTSVRSLPTKESLLLQQLWDDYIQRMVERKGNSKRYPLKQTRASLGWLAHQMRNHGQPAFYLEHLQPDWLTDEQQRTYDWLGVRLPSILIGALVSIIIGWFFLPVLGLLPPPEWQELLRDMTLGGLLGGLLQPPMPNNFPRAAATTSPWQGTSLSICIGIGLVTGLSPGWGTDYLLSDWLIFGVLLSVGTFLLQKVLLVSASRFLSMSRRYSGQWTMLVFVIRHVWRALLVALFIGMSFGLGYRLSYVLSTGASIGQNYGMNNVLNDGMIFGLRNGLNTGLCFGLASILISLILEYLQEKIHLRERVKLTWRNLRQCLFAPTYLRLSLLMTVTLAVFFELNTSLKYGYCLCNQNLSLVSNFALSGGLGYGVIFGLLSWLLLGFFQSIKQEQIEDEDRRKPNEGIKRSLENSLLLGLTIGTMVAGTGILAYALNYGLSAVMGVGLEFGLSDSLNYGLNYGLHNGLTNFWILFIASCILVWITTGGIVVWRHYLIRLLLRHTQTFPWKASQFLDDAKTRMLLQYLRGGYSFTHRLLLDFLADTHEHERENP